MDEETRKIFDDKYYKTLKRLNDKSVGDLEKDHLYADHILIDLLRELGLNKTVKEYIEVGKWYA